MKISESWLREWIDPKLTIQELANQLTMAGLEVDALEAVNPGIESVVVGEIVAIEPHANAKKLSVCQVLGGMVDGDKLGGTLQVVCGASNARVGLKIPFAVVGAKLPGNVQIEQALIRDVESFGMLCGQDELHLGDDASGLWELPADAPTGKLLCDYLQLNDYTIEMDLTPNRSDCLSVKGLARELSTLNDLAFESPSIAPCAVELNDQLPIVLKASSACPRYVGRIIRDVDISTPTPLWMQERLRRSGIACINVIVDVTNYVLLELGQPMHAFDFNALSGDISVRYARADETLELLNGQEVTLTTDTLVIADDDKPLAMAGIMGGKASSVTDATQNILLESAFFDPSAMAGCARRYGLHTDSSHRFERGVDSGIQVGALERATALIVAIAGGKVGPIALQENDHDCLRQRTVLFDTARIQSTLGITLPDADVKKILSNLGFDVESSKSSAWRVTVPSHRFDISIEEDLLEEIARVYGYDRIPCVPPASMVQLPIQAQTHLSLQMVRQQLQSRDYREVISYSFVSSSMQKALDPDTKFIRLKNPISHDMDVMRTSLWQSMMGILLSNIRRQKNRVRLFEVGLAFIPVPQQSQTQAPASEQTVGLHQLAVKQEKMLAGLIYGNRNAESWSSSQEPIDFYDLKGDVESMLHLTGHSSRFEFQAAEHPALHPGQSAAVYLDGAVVGRLGALHPQLQKQFDLPSVPFLFEINCSAIASKRAPSFQALSRYPEVRRDIAFQVDADLAIAELESTVRHVAEASLVDICVFDIYSGEGIDSNRKSVAMGLTFQHLSRTLQDSEINEAVDRVLSHLMQDFAAKLR